MNEKIFKGPVDFAEYFKKNPNMLAAFPWGNHVCNSVDSINKGCGCKKKKRVSNADNIYMGIVKNVLRNNKSLLGVLRKSLAVERLVFELNGKVLLESSSNEQNRL